MSGERIAKTNPETGETAEKEVVETYIRETNDLIHIWVNGEEIVTTPTHPFYVPEKGWTDAIDLRAGDILVLVNGEYVVIEEIQHEITEEPVTVYNFQVADFHTYYAGESSVLVHNANYKTEDSQLGDAAIAARDSEVDRIRGLSTDERNAYATVVGGYNTETSEVVAIGRVSGVDDPVLGRQYCAEDLVVRALGGDSTSVVMTPAIRPRTGDVVDVCVRCETRYSRDAFMPGTTFKSDVKK